MLSTDVRVALAPGDTFRRLLETASAEGWLKALRRPAFIALLIGSVMTVCAARRVTIQVVGLETLAWSFVPLLQMVAAVAIIVSASRKTVSTARALDLFFHGHIPWSLWLLAAAAFISVAQTPFSYDLALFISALIPATWTIVIVFSFCRTVLGTSRSGALIRTAAHQTLIWAFIWTFVFAASGIWPRLLQVVGR